MRLLGVWKPGPRDRSVEEAVPAGSTAPPTSPRSSPYSNEHSTHLPVSRNQHSDSLRTTSAPARGGSTSASSSSSRVSSPRGRGRSFERNQNFSNKRSESPSLDQGKHSNQPSKASSRGRSRSSSRDRSASNQTRHSSSPSSRNSRTLPRSLRGRSSTKPLIFPSLSSQPDGLIGKDAVLLHSKNMQGPSRSSEPVYGETGSDTKSMPNLWGKTKSVFGHLLSRRKDDDSKSDALLKVNKVYTSRNKRHRRTTLPTIQSDMDSSAGNEYHTSVPGYGNRTTEEASSLNNPRQLVNGLLTELELETEVCPLLLRLSLIICASGAIIMTILSYCLGFPITVMNVILLFLTAILSIFNIILEMSFDGNESVGYHAFVRAFIDETVIALKLVWVRGLLTILNGLLQVFRRDTIALVSGVVMILIGSIILAAGSLPAVQLMRLQKSLTDDAHLLYHFARCDTDEDGYHDVNEFASFIVAVGIELEDAHVARAFEAIDANHDGIISFIDFHRWWSQCTVEDVASLV